MKFNWNSNKFKQKWLPRLKKQIKLGTLSSEQDALDVLDNAVDMLNQINKVKPFEIDYDQEMDFPIEISFTDEDYASVHYFNDGDLSVPTGIGVYFNKDMSLHKFLRELSKLKTTASTKEGKTMKLSYDSLYDGVLSIIALYTTSSSVSNKCGTDSFIEWCEDNNKIPHLKQFMKTIKDKTGFWKDLETSGLDFSENPRLKEQIKSLLGITTASTKEGKTMKYSKSLDHLLVAIASLQEGDAETAEEALEEALNSEDLDETLADLAEMQEKASEDMEDEDETQKIVEEALSEEDGVEVASIKGHLTFTMANVRNARQAKRVFKSLASVEDVEDLTEEEMEEAGIDGEEAVKATIDGEEVVVSFDEDGEGEVMAIESDNTETEAGAKKRRTMANDLTDDEDEDDEDWDDEEKTPVTASRKRARTTASASRVKRALAGLDLDRIARNRRSL